MTRHHTVWDATLGEQIDVPFTTEEETARDLEETRKQRASRKEQAEALARKASSERINSDSATLEDVIQFLRRSPR